MWSALLNLCHMIQGLYSLCDSVSFQKISWSIGSLKIGCWNHHIAWKSGKFFSNTVASDWMTQNVYLVASRFCKILVRFQSLAESKLRLCSANHKPGYWSNLPCDWLSTAWTYSEKQKTGPIVKTFCWWMKRGPELHSLVVRFCD